MKENASGVEGHLGRVTMTIRMICGQKKIGGCFWRIRLCSTNLSPIEHMHTTREYAKAQKSRIHDKAGRIGVPSFEVTIARHQRQDILQLDDSLPSSNQHFPPPRSSPLHPGGSCWRSSGPCGPRAWRPPPSGPPSAGSCAAPGCATSSGGTGRTPCPTAQRPPSGPWRSQHPSRLGGWRCARRGRRGLLSRGRWPGRGWFPGGNRCCCCCCCR